MVPADFTKPEQEADRIHLYEISIKYTETVTKALTFHGRLTKVISGPNILIMTI